MQMNYKSVYQQTIRGTRRDVIGHQPARHAQSLICCLRPCFLKQPCLPVRVYVTLKQMEEPPTISCESAQAHYKIAPYKMRQTTSFCSYA